MPAWASGARISTRWCRTSPRVSTSSKCRRGTEAIGRDPGAHEEGHRHALTPQAEDYRLQRPLPREQPNSGLPEFGRLIDWPKSETSDFGWRDREGAHAKIRA